MAELPEENLREAMGGGRCGAVLQPEALRAREVRWGRVRLIRRGERRCVWKIDLALVSLLL